MSDTTTLAIHNDTTEGVQNQPLRQYVAKALENYFSHLEGHKPANLYELVLEEMEIPLLEAIMKFTKNNQSKSAIYLGLSRGTLRKKLKKYGLD